MFPHLLTKKPALEYSWVSYFDNTKWEIRNYGSWNASGWWDSEDDGDGYEYVDLSPIGVWASGFEPVACRITYTGNFDVAGVLKNLTVRAQNVHILFEGLDIISLETVTAESIPPAQDINIFNAVGEQDEDPYKITNIEFAES